MKLLVFDMVWHQKGTSPADTDDLPNHTPPTAKTAPKTKPNKHRKANTQPDRNSNVDLMEEIVSRI